VLAAGWLPRDDVRRHAAKAVSGKEWSEVLVLRAEATEDEHPGWHAMLGALHRATGATPRALASFSVASLAALFLVVPLVLVARPEAWPMALVAVALFDPAFFPRLLSGRPLVLSMTVLAILAASWERFAAERAPRAALAALTALFALVTWVHGTWYLWLLPIAALFAARQVRAATRIALCCAAGTLLGALATGAPLAYLAQSIEHLLWSFGTHDLTRMLATEFQPGQGSPAMVLLVGGLLLWRRDALPRSPLADPVFLVAVAGWVLGLAVSRFWSDWGLPALAVWIAQLAAGALAGRELRPQGRLAATALATGVLLLAVTGNRGDRWSSAEGDRHLRRSDPAHAAWLPAPGGILYSNSMGLFYDTFFENPDAPWRYLVGFEPGMMPPAELATFRAIQRTPGDDRAFAPWVRQLRREDRLVIARSGGGERPRIPELEWFSPFGGLWIGRLPTGS